MAEDELGAVGEVVQARERGGQSSARMRYGATGVPPYGTEGVNATVLGDFKVEGEAGRQARWPKGVVPEDGTGMRWTPIGDRGNSWW